MSTPAVLRSAVALLRRHWQAAYLVSLTATLVNTVPDVLRQVLVWDDPRVLSALAVDVVGFGTALVAQLWVTGAVAGLADGGRPTRSGALRRGADLAVRAVRRAPGTVLAGVVCGGAVSAVLTIPVSVAALGWHRVLGPLDAPGVGAFAVASVSDLVASAVTLPFLAFVLVLAATGRRLTSTPAGQ
ncbi:hypothetical protein [Modestobacter versicolor]|uniref:hypothetical protein n=1 Tax=Modestobacter versicolor TaxID=429133 RepID=UPI0034E00BD9